jgi:TolB-like protein
MPTHTPAPFPDLLDSWKEIAVYLKRDVRTVMRWEQTRGLPVHRLPGGSAVHAFRSELDLWRNCGLRIVDKPEPAERSREAARFSIAVLPFANLVGDQESGNLSEGLAGEIINTLTRVPGVRVSARTSSFGLASRKHDVREIGRLLGVAYVLEGSVQRAGNRIRVTAQLVSVSDGFHVWSEHYDREVTDLFTLEDEVAASIVSAAQIMRLPSGPAH